MKIVGTIVALLLAAGVALAGSYSSEITSNEVVIAGPVIDPSVTLATRSAWPCTNTVGQLAALDGTKLTPVICVVGGTGAITAPQWSPHTDIVDGSTTWRPCLRTPRTRFLVSNTETGGVARTGSVYINFWPNRSAGLPVGEGLSWMFEGGDQCPQGMVYARSDDDYTNTVSVLENW